MPLRSPSFPRCVKRLAVLALPGLLITACATAPDTPTAQRGGITSPIRVVETDSTAPLQLPPSEYSALFGEAETALAQRDWRGAEASLAELSAQPMTPDDEDYLAYLRARIAWQLGNVGAMEDALLGLPRSETAPAISDRILSLQHERHSMAGDSLIAAQIGAERLILGGDEASQLQIRQQLWQDLYSISLDDLRRAREVTPDNEWRAWLDLAIVTTDSRLSSDAVRTGYDQWLMRHPNHPAADPLGGGVDQWLVPQQPTQSIALMLPLGGRLAPAAKAVRDGFLANYYEARAQGLSTQTVMIIDTGLYSTASAAYQDAVSRGADIVVGPLNRASVDELSQLPQRPVPLLALNRAEAAITGDPGTLIQLALAADDDADTLAKRAYGQGLRRALIVRPSGEWGNNQARTVANRWRALGGAVAANATYTNQASHSGALKTALRLDHSEQRARDVRDMLATNVEFTARRRDDIDVVFLLARSGADARSIKPLLAFHYAGDLPVYATSSVYSGIPDNRDRDLDGINMVEAPWLLGANPEARVAIAAGDTGSDSYPRLNALGADAFKLQQRYPQLNAGSDFLLRGDTGLLRLGPKGAITRETQLATFEGGSLTAQ